MDMLYEITGLRCSYDKKYREGVSKVVLEIPSLTIPRGKKVFIVGESGIGKSTILELLGMMNNTIVPDQNTRFFFHDRELGKVDILDMWHRSDSEQSSFRRRNFNFIFQSTNLMRNFTAYENVAITRLLQGHGLEESYEKAAGVLKDLGLESVDRNRMVQELSGGQQQRLAFARAIVPDFTVLFGDEPTGNLDSENAVRAMELLTAKLAEVKDGTAIIVSHDMHIAVSFADIIIKIRKQGDKSSLVADETMFRGIIDDSCAFVPDGSGSWTNGIESYKADDFEFFLRHKQ